MGRIILNSSFNLVSEISFSIRSFVFKFEISFSNSKFRIGLIIFSTNTDLLNTRVVPRPRPPPPLVKKEKNIQYTISENASFTVLRRQF